MDAQSAMRTMIEASGLTHRQISARMGKHETYVSQAVRRAPSSDTLASIARACGYRLELVPMAGGDSLTIGDDLEPEPTTTTAGISEARALIIRAASLLERMDDLG